jgi:very-short-patch-repair endonuclease
VNELESPAEAEIIRMVADRGLPAPTTQVREVLERGTTFRLDIAWRSHRVALEIDGFHYHDGPQRFVAERHRANLLTDAGWHVLRTTISEMRRNPEPLCRALRRLLAGVEWSRDTAATLCRSSRGRSAQRDRQVAVRETAAGSGRPAGGPTETPKQAQAD